MRSVLFILSLALAGCATLAAAPTPRRTLRIENQTPDAVVVRVDGVRVATLLSRRSACIAAPEAGRRLSVSAVGNPSARFAAPAFVAGQSAGWRWRLGPRLDAPAALLDLTPAEPCGEP
jgi:hypothetical protein